MRPENAAQEILGRAFNCELSLSQFLGQKIPKSFKAVEEGKKKAKQKGERREQGLSELHSVREIVVVSVGANGSLVGEGVGAEAEEDWSEEEEDDGGDWRRSRESDGGGRARSASGSRRPSP